MTTPDDERDPTTWPASEAPHPTDLATDEDLAATDEAEAEDGAAGEMADSIEADDLDLDESPAPAAGSVVEESESSDLSASHANLVDDEPSALADGSASATEVADLDLERSPSDVATSAPAQADSDSETSDLSDADTVLASEDAHSASATEVADLDLDEASASDIADGESRASSHLADPDIDDTSPDDLATSEPLASAGDEAESLEVVDSLLGADELEAAGVGAFVDGTDATDIEEPVHLLPLRPSIEAILLVTDEPIPTVTLAQILGRPQPDVAEELSNLSKSYTDEGRGFDLREIAGGWRLYTREEYAEVVERFVLDGQQARLTQAALETLAVVAYKQPVSRTRVSAIRGVNCDGVMRTLLSRGLVQEAGTDDESGAHLYRTTSYFLERLGLDSLSDLPDLAPYLPEIEEMEAEHARVEADPAPEPVGAEQS